MVKSDSIKFNIKIEGRPNSVTVRKDVICLWCLMHDVGIKDALDKVQEFLDDQVVPRWERKQKKYARGLSKFTIECMFKSFLEPSDFKVWKACLMKIGA